MTVQTTTTYQNFAGGQSVLTFNFRTLVSNPSYINVLVMNLSNNTTSILTYGTNYTVAVNTTGVGGTVTVSPTYSTAYQYTVYRSTGEVQSSSYANFNQFPASTLENGLDQLTMLIQEIQTNQGLTLQVPLGLSPTISTTLPTPVANQALGWDSTGTFMVNLNLVSSGVMVIASAADAAGGVQSTHYMTPSTNTIQIQSAVTNGTGIIITTNSTQVVISSTFVSSSTNAVSITTTSTQAIITNINPINISNVPYIKCSNTQAQNTNGGGTVSGSWNTLTLNTKDNDSSSLATLSTNLITIPSGTYQVRANVPLYAGGNLFNSQVRLFSSTSSIALVNGISNIVGAADTPVTIPISGQFTITASSVIILQYQTSHTQSTNGQGSAANFGTEVFSVLEMWKIL